MFISPVVLDKTFTAAGQNPIAGEIYDLCGQGELPKHWTLQVSGVGAAATAWDVALQTSLDGVNFENTITHQSGTDADKLIKDGSVAAVQFKPRRYVKVVLNSITIGSATGLRCVGIGSH